MTVKENSLHSWPAWIMRISPSPLRETTYLWIGVAAFIEMAPGVSIVLASCLFLCLAILRIQRRIWLDEITQPEETKQRCYIDHPKATISYWGWRILLAIVLSAGIGYLLGYSGILSGFQWFLLAFGAFVLKRDYLVFGTSTKYVINDTGFGVLFGDIRLFIPFNAIAEARLIRDIKEYPARWAVLSPTNNIVRDGVLLVPKHPAGFTRIFDHLFITPTDDAQFLEQILPLL